MSLPEVILVGGPPGAGKTTLGRAIAGRLGYASTTVDDLTLAVRGFTDRETHPALHVMPSGHLSYFTHGAVEDLIDDALALQDAMWPVLERVIASHLALKGPIVLDWWLFSPSLVAGMPGNVGSVWLWIDPGVLEDRERVLSVDFVAGSADPDRMLRTFMARSLWRNELLRSEAGAAGLPVIVQDGTKDVASLVSEAIHALDAV